MKRTLHMNVKEKQSKEMEKGEEERGDTKNALYLPYVHGVIKVHGWDREEFTGVSQRT